MNRRLFPLFAMTLVLIVGQGRPSNAGWQVDGASICNATSGQSFPAIVSDGTGGAIIAWVDTDAQSNMSIRAQRVDAAGVTQWSAHPNGVPLCSFPDNAIETSPAIVSDGAGGAIITWNDAPYGCTGGIETHSSCSGFDIYAQRVNSSGVPQWSGGAPVPVCTALGNQDNPRIVSDGYGGAIITWYTTLVNDGAIYAQHISAGGQRSWAPDSVGTYIGSGGYPAIVEDGEHGAIVTWTDDQDHIQAQRVTEDGPIATGWPVTVWSTTGSWPAIVSDHAGGAIITWQDQHNFGNADIYAQRVTASGAIATGWSNGRALCTAANDQQFPQVVSDGDGGAIVTWQDGRDPTTTGFDIYAQHVLASGALDSNWPTQGKALCKADDDQHYPTIVRDETGGAIVTWQDSRNSGATGVDIYAQRITGSGTLLWTSIYDANASNGVALCEAAGDQLANSWEPTIASDGAGGAIVTWHDQRTNGDGDIYARRAQLPESPTIDVVWADTFIQVVWTGGGDVADTGTPLRWVVYVDGDSVGGLAQAPGVEEVVDVGSFTPCSYHQVYVRIIGQHGFLGATSNTVNGQTCCGAMCNQMRPGARAQTIGGTYPLALGSPQPNPARNGTEIRWSIPRERAGEQFQLALFDVGGRRVTTVAEGNAEAGLFTRSLQSRGAAPLPRGVYYIRLQIGREQLTRSLILTR